MAAVGCTTEVYLWLQVLGDKFSKYPLPLENGGS